MFSVNTGLFCCYQSPQWITVPPQTVQLLLEKGHPPAERVHTINMSHCASQSDGTDKDQILSKEEVHQVKEKPEYSFITPGEETAWFTRIFYVIAKFKMFLCFQECMYPFLVCKLRSCINVCILKGDIQAWYGPSQHVSLYSFSLSFSSVVVCSCVDSAQICHFLQSSEKIYLAVIFYQLINFILSSKGCSFLT